MDASSLSDEMLQRIVENGRKLLEEGNSEHPEPVRRVLVQAEDEQARRNRLVWGENDLTFWGEGL